MANKIKYGIRNVYYAIATEGTGGVLTYATPVAIPGAVNLSLSAEGDSTPFYADDVIYFQSTANNGYSGTLEVALIPDSFKTGVLLETADTSGVYIEAANKTPKEFALLFEFQGDDKATRHAMFRCTCSRPDVTGATKEASIEPQTETLNITAMPRLNDYIVKASCPQTATTAYTGWFSAVYSASI
jgi:phi13 family phage major tail protein